MSALKKFLIGAVEAASPTPVAKVVEAAKPSKVEKSYDVNKVLSHSLGPAVAGAVLGVMLFPKHRVLGFLGGASLGGNAYALATDQLQGRAYAATHLAAVGAGVAGSLSWRAHPIAGFLLPELGVSVAAMMMGVKSKMRDA